MFTKSLQSILEEIIGKTFNGLRFNLLGPDRVSKAFVFSMKDHTYNPNTSIAAAYLHANALNTNDPSSIDKKTIQRLTDVAAEYIDSLEQKSSADVSRLVSQYAAEIETQAKITNQTERELMLGEFGTEIIRKLKKDLKEQKKKIDKAAETITEYERHNAMNFGATDGILSVARSIGIEDPTVFKILVDDERLCQKCRALWLLPNGQPKLYKLSELAASPGENWRNPQPSIAPSHVNCRCVLVTLMPHFGFDAKGKIIHKGIDPETGKPWDELAKQRR